MSNKIQKKIPVEVQNRSGNNLSHQSSFTCYNGQIVPIMCRHIMPNSNVSLDVACEVNLPPAISDYYGSIEARMEFFYVPYRTLWQGFKYFFMNNPQGGSFPSLSNTQLQIKKVPGLTISKGDVLKLGRGSLADFLGLKINSLNRSYYVNGVNLPNILPFVGYHRVVDSFYRDRRIQQPLFLPAVGNSDNWTNLPYIFGANPNGSKKYYSTEADGYNILDLRQRLWDQDYFTNATPSPQAGNAVSLQFETQGEVVEGAGGATQGHGSFTISSLRVANALQKFAEINNIASADYAQQQLARFGCLPSDSILDRPIYLGQKRFNVRKRSVFQQSGAEPTNANPFSGMLANQTSALSGYGEGRLGKFYAKDPGLLYVMFSVVPQATYSTGTARYLLYEDLSDFPEPLLQGVGDQPIYDIELSDDNPTSYKQHVFGYTQRYAEQKFCPDQVHGKLVDGENLSMFQLQRSFDSAPDLGTQFLEIPQDYLDQISNVDATISEFGARCNAFFNFKVVQPLAAYSIATLGDNPDTHTVLIDHNKRL